MCGIAGIIGSGTTREQTLDRMFEAQKHRGPDHTGTFVDDQVALGHNRFSVIDLEVTEWNKVEITSLKDEEYFLQTIPSTAEHTWTLILSLLRKLPVATKHVYRGGWNRDIYKSHSLSYYRLGLKRI
jgi:hypothetical protein